MSILTRSSFKSQSGISSKNLVVFDRSSNTLKEIPYPMRSIGTPITPSGISNWLERRGLIWECGCAMLDETPCPIHWRDLGLKGIVGICHSTPSRCGLELILNEIVRTTDFFSSYPEIQTLRQIEADLNQPQVSFASSQPSYGGLYRMRSNYRIHPYAGPAGRSTVRVKLHIHNKARADIFSSNTHGTGTSASTSFASTAASGSDRAVSMDERRLRYLQNGHGLDEFDFDGLFEKCTGCRRYFLREFLRPHIRGCRQESVEL